MEPYSVGIWRHMLIQEVQAYVATDKPLSCLAASNPSELYSVCTSIVISLSCKCLRAAFFWPTPGTVLSSNSDTIRALGHFLSWPLS